VPGGCWPRKRIGLIQFEFGLPAMSVNVSLRDLFDVLDGWYIHRILQDGAVPIGRYHEQ
jgi:hypothetical protein